MTRFLQAALMSSVALAASSCQGQEATSEHPFPPDSFVVVGDVRLHYVDWGGEGELLLMVPGVTATARVYDGIAGAFTDRYRVIAVTRRGHGLSDAPESPEPTLDLLADDLAVVVAAFTDQPAIVVGHSYAGIEIPRLLARHPELVRAVVFLDAVYNWPRWLEPNPSIPGFPSGDSVYASVEEAEDWYRRQFPEFWSPVARNYVRSQIEERDDGSVVWRLPVPSARFSSFLDVYEGWSGAEYRSIQVPVLSIAADQEKFMTANLRRRGFAQADVDSARVWARDFDNVLKAEGAEMLQAAVPNAQLMTMDSTHHMLQLQRPAEIVEAMNSFLGRLGGRTPSG